MKFASNEKIIKCISVSARVIVLIIAAFWIGRMVNKGTMHLYEERVKKQYPEIYVSKEKLYGNGNSNLNGLEPSGDDLLVDEAGGHINYSLGDKVNVLYADLITTNCSRESGLNATIVLANSEISRSAGITSSTSHNVMDFTDEADAGVLKTSEIEIYPADAVGETVNVDGFKINDGSYIDDYAKSHVSIIYQWIFRGVIMLIFFAAAFYLTGKNPVWWYIIAMLLADVTFWRFMKNRLLTKPFYMLEGMILAAFIIRDAWNTHRFIFNRERIKKYGSEIIIGTSTAFLLTFYAPLEFYFTNKNEFWYDFWLMIPYVFGFFVTVASIIVFTLVCLHRIGKITNIAGAYAAAFVVLTAYVHGNFFTANLPALDGTDIYWQDYPNEYMVSIVITIAVAVLLGASILIFKKNYNKIMAWLAGGVSLILLLTLCTLFVTDQGYEKKSFMYADTDNYMTVSKDENFLVILLDAVSGSEVESIISDDPAEYEEGFKDFTFYPNIVSAYPYTSRSIPFILSGQWYENDEAYQDYLKKSLMESEFIDTLKDNGFSCNLYTDVVPELSRSQAADFMQIYDNYAIADVSISDFKEFVDYQLQFVEFRYAPYCIKVKLDLNVDEQNDFKKISDGKEEYNWSRSTVDTFNLLSSEKIELSDNKIFKFQHLDGAHVPFAFGKEMKTVPRSEGSYRNEVEGCLSLVEMYIDKLKSQGVYDNSIIIVMADHGYNSVDGDAADGRQNPVFMVKGLNEHHDFSVDQAPISYDDLQTAYTRLLAGKTSDKIFDWKEGDARSRRFLFYEYLKENHMIEYEQKGYATDPDTLVPTGNIYDR